MSLLRNAFLPLAILATCAYTNVLASEWEADPVISRFRCVPEGSFFPLFVIFMSVPTPEGLAVYSIISYNYLNNYGKSLSLF